MINRLHLTNALVNSMGQTLLRGEVLWAPVSPGELLDKISILEIKEQRFFDAVKHAHVLHELTVLREVSAELTPSMELSALTADLKSVNESLWGVEDDLRDCESRHDFGAQFIALARAVYHHNDRRSAIKRQINELLGSRLVEEKVYVAY